MKTKKLIAIFVLMFLLSVSIAAFSACGANGEDGSAVQMQDEYFFYELNESGDSYSVFAREECNLPSEIVIPSDYNGKPVIAIGGSAFV